MWNGELIRKSTKQGNDRKARTMESAHRTSLANGLVGIREKKPVPTLADFLENDFVPFVETKHAVKPTTAEDYRDGAKMIQKCDWASLPDKITDQQAQHFAAKFSKLCASRIKCGLRSLRRALKLALEWGKLEKPIKITLAEGQRQRDRVLTDTEWQQYIVECAQPWRDVATVIRGTGMRPDEVFPLRWEISIGTALVGLYGHRRQNKGGSANAAPAAGCVQRIESSTRSCGKARIGLGVPVNFPRRSFQQGTPSRISTRKLLSAPMPRRRSRRRGS
jgi:integrase